MIYMSNSDMMTPYGYLYLLFFFSSRRRHTIWPRDWSSDVCSSDLCTYVLFLIKRNQNLLNSIPVEGAVRIQMNYILPCCIAEEIGRASCRERVEMEEG